MISNIEEINKLIRERRSVFPPNYSQEKIPEEIINTILENANWAPNHRNTEPWRFTVFSGEGIKKLAAFQSELYKKVTMTSGDYNEKKYQQLQTKPLKCSHIIAIGMHRDDDGSVPEVEEIEAVAMAVQNMYLTATAFGLGCYWGTGGITYMEEAKPFFNLRPTDRLLGFFFLGKTDRPKPPGKRNPFIEKITWVRE